MFSFFTLPRMILALCFAVIAALPISMLVGCQQGASSSASTAGYADRNELILFVPDHAQMLQNIAATYGLTVKTVKPDTEAGLIFKALLNAPSDDASYFAVINPKMNRLVTAGNVPPEVKEEQVKQVFQNIKDVQTAGVKQMSRLSPDRKDAVKLMVFSDYQCPFCKQVHVQLEEWQKQFGDSLQVEMAHYPLPMHPQALFAAEAAECARTQGHFDDFNEALFMNQKDLASQESALKFVTGLAQSKKLDVASFNSCLAQHQTQESIKDSQLLGQYLGVSGTPTIFVNGKSLSLGDPADMKAQLKKEIEANQK